MIEVEGFSFKYANGSENAADNINLKIDEGDFLGITGPGGAGKTTLTYALSGVIPHHFQGDFYGAIRVDNMDTVDSQPEDISGILGCVFQDVDAQLVSSAVWDEMLFGLENFGIPKDEIESRINEALAMVGIEELAHRDISSLSGGQKQKVAIAAIVALKPKYLVLDEPTGELDPKSSRKIYNLLRELNENHGITIVVVEQKIMLLCEYAKHLAVMDKGKIILGGTVEQALKSSDIMESTGINIPRVVTLCKRLEEKGLYKGENPLTIPMAADMVKKAAEGEA